MKIFTKANIIKFLIIDFVFFTTLYLTIVFAFPVDKIIKANKNLISQKLNKEISFKKAYLGINLSIYFEDLKLKPLANDIKVENKTESTDLNTENTQETTADEKNLKAVQNDKIATNKKEKNEKGEENNKTSNLIKIKQLSISPNLFSMLSSKKPSFEFECETEGGKFDGVYEVRKVTDKGKKANTQSQELNYLNITLKNFSLTEFSNFMKFELPINGMFSGNIETEFGTMNGKMKLMTLNIDSTLRMGSLGAGMVKTTMGKVSLDKIELGDLITIKGKMDGSQFKLEPLIINSKDIEGNLDGTIVFGADTRPNLKLKYKFTDSFLASNKKIDTVIKGLGSVKRKDGFFGYRITGTFEQPRYTPYMQ